MENHEASLDPRRAGVRTWLGIALCVATGIAAASLVIARSPLINGTDYWRWHYQPSPISLGWVVLVGAVVTVLFTAAWLVYSGRGRAPVAIGLIMLAIGAFALRLGAAWLVTREVSLSYVDHVVRHPITGSYYTVAEMMEGHPDALAKYPQAMRNLPLHAQNKPPGWALFNLAFINALGNEPSQQTAGIVGVACGLLSLLCIPLSYALVRALDGSATAAFHAAALWALCPGAAIFFPLFDPLITVPALLLAITWFKAMRLDHYGWSAAMGVVLAGTVLITFNIAPLALFLAVTGLLAAPPPFAGRLRRFAWHAAVVFGVAVVLQVLFWLATGFNLIECIKAALVNQKVLLEQIERPYPATIFWDLVDYAFGVAWIPVVLAGVYLTRIRRPLRLIDIAVLAGLAQLLVTAVTGLLPGETARVWNFLFPLILIPAALELERWPRWLHLIVYAFMAGLTALLARSMVFMWAD